jgi:FAD/FMN-containing dehydrogenase
MLMSARTGAPPTATAAPATRKPAAPATRKPAIPATRKPAAPAARKPAIPGFTGQVITPGHHEYDDLRRVWNAMHDRRPALIARCATPGDVRAAIKYARQHHLPIAVRGGGHSLPGFSTTDNGLVVDLRPMNWVSVDPVARRATAQGGALLGDLDRATQEHGLIVPAGVISHTGVAGLTLGGGVGRLMRRFGLTIDSLRAAQVVTADGRILRAAEDEHPDLFWAIRGGGGNFGVVTEFEFTTHELAELTVLRCYHDLADAHRVLGRAQQVMDATPPDELLWTSFARKAPPLPWIPPHLHGRPGIMSVIEWSGNSGAGRELLTSLRDELGPLASDLGAVPLRRIQAEGDDVFGPGLLSYVKATFADALTPELIDVIADRGRLLGSEVSQIEVLSMGGAIRRVAPDATAFPHRNAAWLINIPASWRSPADSTREIAWVRDTFAVLHPVCAGGAYVNFMDRDEPAADGAAYGQTLDRLRAVKAVYDPDNVFRLNQNITPRAAA